MGDVFGAVAWVTVEEGSGRVEARRCTACGAIVTQKTLACPSCGARGTMQVFTVADTGRLHSWSIVHRSFPGVPVPFISAVVDMDDGTVLKSNLRGIPVEPEAIRFGMPVRLVMEEAGQDAAGNRFLGYVFEAA
ncbi:Zn-ribbon domain-containing OB-fold protein [Sphingomonas sp. CJ20]